VAFNSTRKTAKAVYTTAQKKRKKPMAAYKHTPQGAPKKPAVAQLSVPKPKKPAQRKPQPAGPTVRRRRVK